jgi:hypothetical protein
VSGAKEGAVFSDPQVVIGMIIGVVIHAGGTFLGVSAHRKREPRERAK